MKLRIWSLRLASLSVAGALLLLAPGAAVSKSQANLSPAVIAYTLTINDPVSHFYDVQIEISGLPSSTVEVAMPAWAPGVYAIRDYARNVQQFEAVSKQERMIRVARTDKQTWRISKAPTDDIQVRYRVYSTSLNDEMADITGPATFMYVVGHTQAPVSLKYDVPGNWDVYTPLERRGDGFRAPDYDTFVDAPAFIGDFKVLEFKSSNDIPHRMVFSNPRVQLTNQQVLADLEDMTEAALKMFGKLPYREYTYLVRVQPVSGAASLGHLNSSRITIGENDFVNQSGYLGFLVAAAQGYSQTWLGKRIRQASTTSAARYDYSKESYSRLLWFTEGVSAYYADLLLLRAKILTPPEYYARVSSEIDALQDQPGRKMMTLEDASWNTWTRSDNNADSAINYWLKGKIAGLLLDIDIRGRTQGARTLDDVLRHLVANYAEKGIGITEEDLVKSIDASAGISSREFFEHAVRGRAELDYNRYLDKMGLQVSMSRSPSTIQFGIEFERIEGNQVRIRRVLPDSAAASARLDTGDVLIAMDSERITYDNLTSRIHSKRVGRPVALTVLRGERLLSLSLSPREFQSEVWTLQESLKSTPEQIRLRTAWLGG